MDPQVEQILGMMQGQRAFLGQLLPSDPVAARAESAKLAAANQVGGPELEVVEDREIRGPDGHIPVRVFLPANRRGVYLHLHGGGWVLGSHTSQDRWLRTIADAAGVAIVSVGYRLAPEHPYPAGLNDCVAAARWLAANASELCPQPERLAIGGESAGANLAAATLLRLRDDLGAHPFAGAALTFGVYDAALDLPSMVAWGERELVLSMPIMQAFVDLYRGPVNDPYVSPLRADLRGMPPACFVVGDLDPLLSDTEKMLEAWRDAGNGWELHLYADGFHGFTGVPQLDIGRRATGNLISFLADKVGKT